MNPFEPCIKCVISDSIDGYGRCTNCKEPEATKEEKRKIFDNESKHRKVMREEGQRNGN